MIIAILAVQFSDCMALTMQWADSLYQMLLVLEVLFTRITATLAISLARARRLATEIDHRGPCCPFSD